MDGPIPTLLQPPWSEESERSVLGSLMIDPSALTSISDWLTEADFFRRDHRLIFRSISTLIERREPCDVVTLGEWFRAQGIADEVGGCGYVMELANNTPSAANVVAYAEIIAEQSRKRQAIGIAMQAQSDAFARGSKAEDVISQAMAALSNLQVSKLRSGLKSSKPLAREWYADLVRRHQIGDRVTGMSTPWREVNEATHGLQDGELIILAGRPNMGKSVAGFNLAEHVAGNGERVAVFSLEMTSTQVMRRCVASRGDIPHDWLLAPNDAGLSSELYWSNATRAHTEIGDMPMLIDDTPALTIDQITAIAKRAHLQQRLRLVIVDHLHIVRRKGDNDVRELGQISGGLKALAKDLGCPVVALAQLNRSVTGRTDKRPLMADLRASGEIEQDADLILLLHREDYYDRATHLRGVVEMEIAKGRDVKTGTQINLANRFDVMRLQDWQGPLPEKPVSHDGESKGLRRGKAQPTDYKTGRDGE